MFSQSMPRNHGWACAEEEGVSKTAAETPMTRNRNLDQMRAIHTAHSPLRRDEAAAARLHNHGVRPANRGRRLRSEAIFWFAEQLLHQIDAFMRYPWAGWEAEGLFPVQDLLPSDMPLVCVTFGNIAKYSAARSWGVVGRFGEGTSGR